ncbi:MAG: exodeoxyribonuclease VII large subunit [Bacillus subtilis]|nr:exodeoxyribonuclease VII large subunit [Bacillus subtilis]
MSNWRPAGSGHVYFTLKDRQAMLQAVLFRGRASRLDFSPADGMLVRAEGSLSVYAARGPVPAGLRKPRPGRPGGHPGPAGRAQAPPGRGGPLRRSPEASPSPVSRACRRGYQPHRGRHPGHPERPGPAERGDPGDHPSRGRAGGGCPRRDRPANPHRQPVPHGGRPHRRARGRLPGGPPGLLGRGGGPGRRGIGDPRDLRRGPRDRLGPHGLRRGPPRPHPLRGRGARIGEPEPPGRDGRLPGLGPDGGGPPPPGAHPGGDLPVRPRVPGAPIPPGTPAPAPALRRPQGGPGPGHAGLPDPLPPPFRPVLYVPQLRQPPGRPGTGLCRGPQGGHGTGRPQLPGSGPRDRVTLQFARGTSGAVIEESEP